MSVSEDSPGRAQQTHHRERSFRGTSTSIFNFAAFAIVVFAVLLRLYHIHNPLLDHPAWRQGDTASIARNFATLQYNIMYPQTNYDGPPPNYVELELQIVPFLAASLYKVFGVHEIFGRLITLGFSVGTVAVIGLFGRWLFTSASAGLACCVFLRELPGKHLLRPHVYARHRDGLLPDGGALHGHAPGRRGRSVRTAYARTRNGAAHARLSRQARRRRRNRSGHRHAVGARAQRPYDAPHRNAGALSRAALDLVALRHAREPDRRMALGEWHHVLARDSRAQRRVHQLERIRTQAHAISRGARDVARRRCSARSPSC